MSFILLFSALYKCQYIRPINIFILFFHFIKLDSEHEIGKYKLTLKQKSLMSLDRILNKYRYTHTLTGNIQKLQLCILEKIFLNMNIKIT